MSKLVLVLYMLNLLRGRWQTIPQRKNRCLSFNCFSRPSFYASYSLISMASLFHPLQNAPEDKTSILTRINALLDSSKWTSWNLFEFFWFHVEHIWSNSDAKRNAEKLCCIVLTDSAGRSLFSPQPASQATTCGPFVSYPGFQPTPPDSRSPSPLHMDDLRTSELFMVIV